MEHQSVTVWLRQLANSDQEAAKKLWDRYGPELVELPRRRFGGALGVLGDEEVLDQSVFRTLWTWATDGRLDGVQDREDHWWLLLKSSRRKALNRHAYNKRQKRDHPTISRSGFYEVDRSPAPENLIADGGQPHPDLILILAEEQERLLEMLDDDVLKLIAVWKMDSHSHEDIAQKLKVTTRTVIRKLNLIREIWCRELDS